MNLNKKERRNDLSCYICHCLFLYLTINRIVFYTLSVDSNKLNHLVLPLTDPFIKTRKIYFNTDKVVFDGVPFMVIGSRIYDCQHGPDRKKSEKKKISQQKVTFEFKLAMEHE